MPVVSTGTRLAAPVPQQGGDSLHPGGAVFAVWPRHVGQWPCAHHRMHHPPPQQALSGQPGGRRLVNTPSHFRQPSPGGWRLVNTPSQFRQPSPGGQRLVNTPSQFRQPSPGGGRFVNTPPHFCQPWNGVGDLSTILRILPTMTWMLKDCTANVQTVSISLSPYGALLT